MCWLICWSNVYVYVCVCVWFEFAVLINDVDPLLWSDWDCALHADMTKLLIQQRRNSVSLPVNLPDPLQSSTQQSEESTKKNDTTESKGRQIQLLCD